MKIAIIGAGVMGNGIAQVCALSGYQTILYDLNAQALDQARETILQQLNKGISLGKLTESDRDKTLGKLTFTDRIEAVHANLIIEAIVEKIDVKIKIMNDLSELNGERTIYGSNTSSIPLTRLAAGFKFPQQVIGIHFFNPAHIMPLVEVISAEQTSGEVLNQVLNFVKSLSKVSIVAKDAPGFIVNRVARHFYVEGLKILEEGLADHRQIDVLIESLGFKMGPFRLMDLIGVETNLSVTQSMYELFNYDQKFRPSRIQQKKVQAGYYGRKSGRGFYEYR